MLPQIKFRNPVGLKGERFVTVRRGRELFDSLEADKVLELCSDDGKSTLGRARVVDFCRCPLAEVPAMLLELHHDPLGRTFTGLLVGLQAIEGPMSVTDEVTVAVLEPVKSAGLRLPTMDQIKRLRR